MITDDDITNKHLRTFGPVVRFKLYGFTSTTLHVTDIPETLPVNDQSNKNWHSW